MDSSLLDYAFKIRLLKGGGQSLYISRKNFEKKSWCWLGRKASETVAMNVLSLFFGVMALDFLSNRSKNDSLVAENESVVVGISPKDTPIYAYSL